MYNHQTVKTVQHYLNSQVMNSFIDYSIKFDLKYLIKNLIDDVQCIVHIVSTLLLS